MAIRSVRCNLFILLTFYITMSESTVLPENIRGKATALLLDMDGILAEVSQSYRAATVATCREYGATSVTYDVISQWKARGGCNNDWQLSLDLIKEDPNGKKEVTYDQVVETFERHYQGDPARSIKGLCELETLIPTKKLLEEFKSRIDALNVNGKKIGGMAVVTGRPRKDCETFLKLHGLEHLFAVSVCMEDGPPKPDPHILLQACKEMGISPSPLVLMVGDTPDDIRAGIAAGCTAVGVVTPENALKAARDSKPFDSCLMSQSMKECGAHVMLEPGFEELLNAFPAAGP
jgi:HAD superfamily phosphatase